MQFDDSVRKASQTILERKFIQPKVGIVLGSGLGGLAKSIEHSVTLPYAEIPGFPPSHAAGHQGSLVSGFLNGVPVVALSGRAHRYEGWDASQIAFPTRVLIDLGIELLITTNAAGGLNPRFQAGDLMVIDSHIDFLWGGSTQTSTHHRINPVQPISRGASYDVALIEQAKRIARRQDTTLHQGCYLATTGPTYETRSEYSMFREFGGDAVGMSTVPEVLVAREAGIGVLAFSVITNVASPLVPSVTTHEEVIQMGKSAGPRLEGIVCDLLDHIAGQPD